MNIIFDSVRHAYYPEAYPTKLFTSVSKLIEMVKPKFEKDRISKDYAIKHGLSQEEVLEKWALENKMAIDKGKAYHAEQEEILKAAGAKPGQIQDGEVSRAIDINNLQPGTYSELIIPYVPQWLIGTADVIHIHENGEFIIEDFKGFSLDTLIPTKTGWITMGDIKVGDEIFDGNGKVTKVKNVSQIHYNPTYRVTFDSRKELVCDEDHRWEVSYRIKNTSKMVNAIMTTKEIKEHYNNKGTKVIINCVSIDTFPLDLPIDPYVLGLWLGDGNRTCGTLTCIRPAIWEEIKKRGYDISGNHNENLTTEDSKAESRTIYGLRTHLRELNLLGNKHIPDLYLRSSYEQRLDILRGYMDADGYYNPLRKRFCMTTTKELQATSISTLVSSLGMKCVVFPYKTKGFGKENIQAWSVNFTTNINPFLSRNKDCIEDMGDKSMFRSKFHYITKIEEIDIVPTKCIEVESETHTYLVGESFIKTHNTNKSLSFSGKAFYNKKIGRAVVEKMLPPMSHLDNVNGNHYNLQLSLYSYFLESYGFKLREGIIRHVLFDEEGNTTHKDYALVYMKKEVENLLKWYKLKK